MAVLLDILLDAESGWTLLAEMKGQAATKDIPILVLTVVEGKERALGAGRRRLLPQADRPGLAAGPAQRPGAEAGRSTRS